MAKHYATSVVRAKELKIGFELLLPSGMDGVPPAHFVIDGIKLIDDKRVGQTPTVRLTSDLPEGPPYTVDFPQDAIVMILAEPNDYD
jgi:hypothetical protein